MSPDGGRKRNCSLSEKKNASQKFTKYCRCPNVRNEAKDHSKSFCSIACTEFVGNLPSILPIVFQHEFVHRFARFVWTSVLHSTGAKSSCTNHLRSRSAQKCHNKKACPQVQRIHTITLHKSVHNVISLSHTLFCSMLWPLRPQSVLLKLLGSHATKGCRGKICPHRRCKGRGQL